jgi:polyisoprenyl-phosphate glycosyltransferase
MPGVNEINSTETGLPEQRTVNLLETPLITIITPAFNESENIPVLYERLQRVLGSLKVRWEWIVVDDHSTDNTYGVLQHLTEQEQRLRVFRFSRNFGSHMALTCGLNYARGDCAVIMAADLQDPPEEIPVLFAKWREGAQVVWAARERREGESATTLSAARLYYFLMRHMVGFKEMSASGADFFLLDRRVIETFRQFKESNVSVLALITWMGFRQTSITYIKKARAHGRSSWSVGKKFKMFLDSILSFSYLPIRWISLCGIAAALAGFIYAIVVLVNAVTGSPIQGWSSLMIVVLIFGGVQMLMLGILGEYLWRTLSETRGRPRYIIEAYLGKEKPVD